MPSPSQGPYGRQFLVPRDESANLLLIGIGTGIAPFRAFIKHIYEERGSWKGKVRLFYGAKTPLKMLYMNEIHNDLGQYYDQETFRRHRLTEQLDFMTRNSQNQVMKQVMVSKLKAHLSAYLASVRSGESVLVLDRKTPIARLVPYDQSGEDFLVDEPPLPKDRLKSIKPLRLRKAIDALEMLRRDRDQR